jgi:hypothetical protein
MDYEVTLNQDTGSVGREDHKTCFFFFFLFMLIVIVMFTEVLIASAGT